MTGDRTANIGKVVAEASSETGTIDALLVGGVELKSLLDAKALYGPLRRRHSRVRQARRQALQGRRKAMPPTAIWCRSIATRPASSTTRRRCRTPPQTWAEFTAWLDANPGQFAFNDPSKGGSGQAFVQAAIVNILGDAERYDGDTELDEAKVADWGKVWDWFNANEDKFTITASNNDSLDRVNQGEVMMAAAWDDDTAVSLAKGTLVQARQALHPVARHAGRRRQPRHSGQRAAQGSGHAVRRLSRRRPTCRSS